MKHQLLTTKRFDRRNPGGPTFATLWVEPRDCWIGVYWNVERSVGSYRDEDDTYLHSRWLFVYVCVLPCLPLLLTFRMGAERIARAHK